MSEPFTLTCRAVVIDHYPHLHLAIAAAQQQTAAEWIDVAIWNGTEMVAIVAAGGSVRLLHSECWTVPGGLAGGFLDLEVLEVLAAAQRRANGEGDGDGMVDLDRVAPPAGS
jgi:hypothetical protein